MQELAHQILRVNALQDLARGISVNVVQVSRRDAVQRHPGRGARHGRRAGADGGGRGAKSMRRFAACSRSTRGRRIEATRRLRSPAAGTQRQGRASVRAEAREVARELGQELGEGGTGGGSDGNFTAALGVPTLDGLGAIGDGAHALHEHVDIDVPAGAGRARRRVLHDAEITDKIVTL